MKYFAVYPFNWLGIPSPILPHVPPKKTLPLSFLDTLKRIGLGHASANEKEETLESELSLGLSNPCYSKYGKGLFLEPRGAFHKLWKIWKGMT